METARAYPAAARPCSTGTSAAAPLWAALVAQFNAIFQDQGLPPLGYMNDLLYIAAAVAPAASALTLQGFEPRGHVVAFAGRTNRRPRSDSQPTI